MDANTTLVQLCILSSMYCDLLVFIKNCTKLVRYLDIMWPCILIIMIIKWLFSGILFIVFIVSFASLAALGPQKNNIPSKSHVIPLFPSGMWLLMHRLFWHSSRLSNIGVVKFSGVCKRIAKLFIFSIIAQVIIEMRALWLVENYVISRYNHPARGDYNTEALIFKIATARFLDVFGEETNRMKEN